MQAAPDESMLPGGGGGGGSFGSMFGNTNAAAGSGSSFAALPSPTAAAIPSAPGTTPLIDPAGGSLLPRSGVAAGASPVTAPVGPTSPLAPSATPIGNNFQAINPLDPGLTQQLFSYLQSMIGQGATPFSSTSILPSGGSTAPGQLSAPLNQLMQQLMQFYSGGSTNAPGLNSLTSFANNGQPIDQTPAWQAMVDSMQRNISQNEGQLKESMSLGGNLVGSPYGTAMADFRSQTAKDENAQLLAAQTQAQEAAKQRQLGASGELLQGNQAFSSNVQGLDQNAINAQLQEFLRTQPEYSPLLNLQYGAGTTFPPVANYNSGIGILGSILQNLGGLAPLLSKIPGLGGVFGGSSSGSSSGGGSVGGITLPGGIHIPLPGSGSAPSMSDNTGAGGALPNSEGGFRDPNLYHEDPSTGLMVPNPTIPGGQGLSQFGFGPDPTPPDPNSLGLGDGIDWGFLLGGSGGPDSVLPESDNGSTGNSIWPPDTYDEDFSGLGG